jgi:carbonic anhydrase
MKKSQSTNQQHQSDSSNLVSIEDLAKKAVHAKLEEDNVGLSQTIDKLLKLLEEKESEIDHLKSMLGRSVPIIGELNLSNEEIIAEKQIARLREFSMLRELTLDEAKRLDIFVKIKHLNEKKDEPEASKLPKDVTPKDLILIATGKKKVD